MFRYTVSFPIFMAFITPIFSSVSRIHEKLTLRVRLAEDLYRVRWDQRP